MPDAASVQRIEGLADLCRVFELSAETQRRLARFDELFVAYAAHTNLVAPKSLPDRWVRHYADSLQLLPFMQDTGRVLDIGSGGGFPGLLLGVALADEAGPAVTVIDSVGKKTRFLVEVRDALGLDRVTVVTDRVENLPHENRRSFDVVTARAVASVAKLLPMAVPCLASGGRLLLPKGESGEQELTESRRGWTFDVTRHPSLTRDGATIFEISEPRARS